MGGYGSGRQGGRPTIEGCQSLKLVINRGMRPGAEALRRHGPPEDAEVQAGFDVTWTEDDAAEPLAGVQVTLACSGDCATASLRFDIDHLGGRTGPQAQRVDIVSTPCRYGGRRWWWLCPRTGRRCGKLYLPNGGPLFLGRTAYRLAYASQGHSALDRSHDRLRRLHRKLGGQYGCFDDPLPDKPKGMRWRTYERLVAEWEDTSGRHDDMADARTVRLAARLLARHSPTG